MKAIAYQKFGSINELQIVEESKPAIQSNQVLVKVKAVSLNPIDWKIRRGEMTLLIEEENLLFTALETSDIVLFVTQTNAAYFDGGMYSGNLQ